MRLPAEFEINKNNSPFTFGEKARLPKAQRIIERELENDKFVSRSVDLLAELSGLTHEEVIEYCERSAHISQSPFENSSNRIYYGQTHKLLIKYIKLSDGSLCERTTILPKFGKDYHYFISHASEDKNTFVRPLAEELQKFRLSIWYDEFILRGGDSLRVSIDRGLMRSIDGIVVLSPFFFSKKWPERELNGLVAKEIENEGSIIPIWFGVSKSEVFSFSPPLADKVAYDTTILSIAEIAYRLYECAVAKNKI